MNKSELNKLILESYAEVLTELNEAPEGMYYIEVSVRDARKAMGIMDDMYRKQFEMNGSTVYYFTDSTTAFDAMMDLAAHDIEILDSNLEDFMNEIDRNDPVLMKSRAAQAKQPDTKFAVGKKNNIERSIKIKDLERKRAQVVRGMEQEAEPEGGPIADKYGSVLNKIDQVLLRLRGKKLNESMLDEVEDEEPTPEEEPDTSAGAETVLEDATDTILAKFPTVKAAIVKLQTEDFKQFVDSVDWISPRPTAFRVNLKNGQDYSLKWTGKTFEVSILGKRYILSKISEYQQALDKLAILYKEAPMKGAGEEEGGDNSDFGSAGGSGGADFPGEEGGAEGGEDFGADDGADLDVGDDAPAADLGGEEIDFEDGEEG